MDVPRTFELVSQLEKDVSRPLRLVSFEDGCSPFEFCPIEAGEVIGRHDSGVRLSR